MKKKCCLQNQKKMRFKKQNAMQEKNGQQLGFEKEKNGV